MTFSGLHILDGPLNSVHISLHLQVLQVTLITTIILILVYFPHAHVYVHCGEPEFMSMAAYIYEYRLFMPTTGNRRIKREVLYAQGVNRFHYYQYHILGFLGVRGYVREGYDLLSVFSFNTLSHSLPFIPMISRSLSCL